MNGIGAVAGRGLILACVGLLALALAAVALAKHAGELDKAFGDKGFVFSHPAGQTGLARAVAVGKKDKPVVAGDARNGFGVVRYTRHGRVDSSFGRDGVRTNFGPPFAEAHAVDVGNKGVVVAAGEACHRQTQGGFRCNFALAKYESSGQRDKSFGDNGKVELTFGPGGSGATSVAFTGHGKILVAGSTCAAFGDCDFALARLLPNGDPDPSFGPSGNGRVVTSFQNAAGDPINAVGSAMAIESHGRVAVGGNSSEKRGLLALYDSAGGLVSSFGQGGKVSALGALGAIAGLAVDANDKIVAAGVDRTNPGQKWVLARIDQNGGLDHSFGNDGRVTTAFPGPGNVDAAGLAIDSKNRIVVTGGPKVSLARYQPNGKLNKSFGRRGRVTKKRADGDVGAVGVAIDSRNRPVVAGAISRFFVAARFLG